MENLCDVSSMPVKYFRPATLLNCGFTPLLKYAKIIPLSAYNPAVYLSGICGPNVKRKYDGTRDLSI